MRYSKERVVAVKASYPIGTRIQLDYLCNDENPSGGERDMPTGLRGTVVGVDDQPSLLMNWDNGRMQA